MRCVDCDFCFIPYGDARHFCGNKDRLGKDSLGNYALENIIGLDPCGVHTEKKHLYKFFNWNTGELSLTPNSPTRRF